MSHFYYSEILLLHLESKTIKRSAINEIMELKESCQFNQFGRKCIPRCNLCEVRDLYENIHQAYMKRQTLSESGRRGLYRNLIQLLSRDNSNGMVLAAFDNMCQIILYVALDQLRESMANHIRGVRLNNAPGLEQLLTFYRRNLNIRKLKEANRFVEIRNAQTSVFNDEQIEQLDFKRSHLVHLKLDFTAGFYLGQNNSAWIKKGWNDEETCEILQKSESIKRRLRHSLYNVETELEFSPSEFDVEHMVYKNRALNYNEIDIRKPIMPKKISNKTLIL